MECPQIGPPEKGPLAAAVVVSRIRPVDHRRATTGRGGITRADASGIRSRVEGASTLGIHEVYATGETCSSDFPSADRIVRVGTSMKIRGQ
jgi:hypothetical protein